MKGNVLLIIGILLVVGSGAFTYFYFFDTEEIVDKVSQSERENDFGVVEERFATDPDSNTARRYFAVGDTDFLDFREDGVEGEFDVDVILREGGEVEVQWDQSVDVYEVLVQDMGDLDNLEDHETIFSDATMREYNSSAEDVVSYDIQGSLSPPYIIDENDFSFTSQNRYSVELVGLREGEDVWSSFTFTYNL